MRLSHLSEAAPYSIRTVLQELAPLRWLSSPVAGYHRASPSTCSW